MASSGGIGFTGAFFLVLFVLKLTVYPEWSWWLVTAPLWVSAILVAVILVLAVIGIIVAAIKS